MVQTAFSTEVGYLKIRYKTRESGISEIAEFPMEGSAVKENSEDASGDFKFAAAVASFAALPRCSIYPTRYSSDDIAGLARGSIGRDPGGDRQAFVTLVGEAKSLSKTPQILKCEHRSDPR